MDKERVLRQQTVIVRNGVIVEIGDARRIKIPSRAQKIDGTGKFLIPGLTDMHVHLFTEDEFPDRLAEDEFKIMIAHGVTTIRLMTGTAEQLVLRIWPAFWLLGEDIDVVGWPRCGEIDIMENIGKEPSIIHGTIHGPGYSGGEGISSSYSLSNNRRFADSFHTFAVEWEPNVVRFYCDGFLYSTKTPADLPAGKTWVLNKPFFILLNLAVGGNWPGSPDETTVFPQTMLIDYVRVYQRVKR